MPNKNKKQIYSTSSFYLSCFLLCNEIELINIDKSSNPRRAIFNFQDTLKREKLVNTFNFGKKALVDVRRFTEAQRQLKNAIYEK